MLVKTSSLVSLLGPLNEDGSRFQSSLKSTVQPSEMKEKSGTFRTIWSCPRVLPPASDVRGSAGRARPKVRPDGAAGLTLLLTAGPGAVEPPPNRWRIALKPSTCSGASAGGPEEGKKKKFSLSCLCQLGVVFLYSFVLNVSAFNLAPPSRSLSVRLQSRVNYIYFVMFASLFLVFISSQSAPCFCSSPRFMKK